MIGRQPYAEKGPEEMGNGSRGGSPVSLASTIDHKNLWKYKPETLQQDNISANFQQKRLNDSLQKNEARRSSKNSESEESEQESEDSDISGNQRKVSLRPEHEPWTEKKTNDKRLLSEQEAMQQPRGSTHAQ